VKKTELKELKIVEIKDLIKKVTVAKTELAKLSLDVNTQGGIKGSKDTKVIFKKKKDIARMLTILRQKELLAKLRPQEAKV
jgi:ribosomal protein L29